MDGPPLLSERPSALRELSDLLCEDSLDAQKLAELSGFPWSGDAIALVRSACDPAAVCAASYAHHLNPHNEHTVLYALAHALPEECYRGLDALACLDPQVQLSGTIREESAGEDRVYERSEQLKHHIVLGNVVAQVPPALAFAKVGELMDHVGKVLDGVPYPRQRLAEARTAMGYLLDADPERFDAAFGVFNTWESYVRDQLNIPECDVLRVLRGVCHYARNWRGEIGQVVNRSLAVEAK